VDDQVAADAEWHGDVLSRKPIAVFLHRYLLQKWDAMKDEPQAGALCFALDAPWGLGKSFFIERWSQDLRDNLSHPVIVFDAWKNDLSQEPLLSFISELRKQLVVWVRKIPPGERHAHSILSEVKDFTAQARRALLPSIASVGKGVARHYLKEGVDELADLWSGDALVESAESSPKVSDAVATDKVLDKIFIKTLQRHAERITAVSKLKEHLQNLLGQIQRHSTAILPMFVLIDELDRCRPSYAIELLEGIKHLFDVHGICFCVSTNLPQLSASIKGVYGSEFDARMYLKRFFAFEYRLPEPNYRRFADLLASKSLFLRRKSLTSGVIDTKGDSVEIRVAKSFEFVTKSFAMDLRSQKQVFLIAEAAAAGVPEQYSLHLVYMFTLAAIVHFEPELFDKLASRELTAEKATELLQSRRMNGKVLLSFQVPAEGDTFHSTWRTKNAGLGEVFCKYAGWAARDLKDLRDAAHKVNSVYDYPSLLVHSVASEMPQSHFPDRAYTPSIAAYANLIRTAGQMREAQTQPDG
jgi:hypothetical protein